MEILYAERECRLLKLMADPADAVTALLRIIII